MSCYTSVHITVKDAMALGCYSSDYTELISKVKDRINGIADRRCDIRYSEYKNETATYINDAKLKFEEERTPQWASSATRISSFWTLRRQ